MSDNDESDGEETREWKAIDERRGEERWEGNRRRRAERQLVEVTKSKNEGKWINEGKVSEVKTRLLGDGSDIWCNTHPLFHQTVLPIFSILLHYLVYYSMDNLPACGLLNQGCLLLPWLLSNVRNCQKGFHGLMSVPRYWTLRFWKVGIAKNPKIASFFDLFLPFREYLVVE